jgi:hypothetical protein
MKPKLNAFLRILTVVLALAAVAFAVLLKGKMDLALTSTEWVMNDAELKPATKDYDVRIAAFGKPKLEVLLNQKRQDILNLTQGKNAAEEDAKKKAAVIDELSKTKDVLEGERTELTRKRDELAAQLTDANSKKDGAEAALAATKEELVAVTEKAAGMFTKDQLAEIEAKATAAEEKAELIVSKYRALHTRISRAMDGNPSPFGFGSDPLGQPAKPGDEPTAVAVAVDAPIENILTNVLALDSGSGIVAFSVGETNGIKSKDMFDVKIDGKKVGKVVISSVKGSVSYGQLQPDKDLDLRAISKASSVSLAPASIILSAN